MRGASRLVLAFATLAAGAAPLEARADWEVRRSTTREHDLAANAERAFTERPEDVALARRLIRLVGATGRAALRTRVCEPARAPTAAATDLLRCATLTFELGGADEEAASTFARAAAARPSLAAFEGEARTLARLGHKDEARARYEAALPFAHRPADERRVLEAALALVDVRAEPARALAFDQRLAALDPRDTTIAERVADDLARLGRSSEAAALLDARLPSANDEERFALSLRAAELYDAAGEHERAAAALAAILARTPRAAIERRRLVWARAVEVARRREALPALAAELARAPGPVEWDVLGDVREELGDLEGALEAARRAAGPRPDRAHGDRVVALLERLGRADEVVSTYEAFSRAAPRDPAWPLALVEAEMRRGQRRRAGEHLDAAATRLARDADAVARLAEVAARWGDDGRALALWTRVTRLAPHDERALRGLAEAQLALGRHADAVSTWRRLCARDGRGPEARLRLVELLLEHDFVDEARTALPPLEGPLARSTRAARLSAEILERQGKMGDATRAWQAVIANARGDDQADERREARARLLALLARGDRAGLDALVRTLADEARAHPGDRERALFLAEARQRAGDEAGAIAGLRALLDGAPAPEATTVDVTFALVRLLRGRGGNGDEALRRLEALARRFPARAREAHVLMADLGMARHDEGAALAHAEEAARLAPDDGEALARVAAIEERAGDDAAATATYRRALALDPGGPSGLALAHLLTRAGDGDGASRVLHTLLETSNDDDVLLEAGRAALAVDEYTNRLPELARLVAAAPRGGARAEATRRLLADVLARVAPTLAREAFFDAEARDSLAHLGRAGAGAVLALVTEAGIDPDRRDVELLGWLGQTDAAPVLARLAAPPPDGPRDEAEPTRPVAKDVQLAALVALGRLADPRGRDALAALALSGEPRLRAAAIWALGRLGDARDAATLTHAARDARPDLAGLACLGLGRTKSSRAVELLTSLAVDAERPTLVRRAAIAGLAFARDRTATPALLTLASSGDDALEQAALIALSATRDARAFSLVLARAARDGAAGPGGRALGLWVAGGALPDEAVAVDGPRLDLEALLDALTPPPTSSVPPAAWTPWARDLASALDDVLAAGGDPRAAALAALAEGGEALGLGALAAPDDTTPALATARAVIGTRIRPRLVALSGDEDPAVRLPARRALAKIDRSAHP